jgi:hypothetical protein
VVAQLDEGFQLQFEDLRAEILIEREEPPSIFEYELRSVASRAVLARGALTETGLTLTPALLERIGASSSDRLKAEDDRGVASLSLRRRGETKTAQVYLHYDSSRRALRVIGVETAS